MEIGTEGLVLGDQPPGCGVTATRVRSSWASVFPPVYSEGEWHLPVQSRPSGQTAQRLECRSTSWGPEHSLSCASTGSEVDVLSASPHLLSVKYSSFC